MGSWILRMKGIKEGGEEDHAIGSDDLQVQVVHQTGLTIVVTTEISAQ